MRFGVIRRSNGNWHWQLSNSNSDLICSLQNIRKKLLCFVAVFAVFVVLVVVVVAL